MQDYSVIVSILVCSFTHFTDTHKLRKPRVTALVSLFTTFLSERESKTKKRREGNGTEGQGRDFKWVT